MRTKNLVDDDCDIRVKNLGARKWRAHAGGASGQRGGSIKVHVSGQ